MSPHATSQMRYPPLQDGNPARPTWRALGSVHIGVCDPQGVQGEQVRSTEVIRAQVVDERHDMIFPVIDQT